MSTTLPSVCSVTATCGRHTLLERSLKFFLDQDYEGEHNLLIYNNSEKSLELDVFDTPPNKRIILVNNSIDSVTGKRYDNLGAIYRDAMAYVPNVDLITFSDDDDGFLPNHISEGVKGYLKAKSLNLTFKAYKPNTSYYKHAGGVIITGNRLEPSMFVDAYHVKSRGFLLETTAQHMGWLGELEGEGTIFIDTEGTPTLIYDWGSPFPTWKTSGDPTNPQNFDNYRSMSADHGDGIITPWESKDVADYYKEALDCCK